MELIAVIMAAETSRDRTKDAIALLNYGFGKCSVYKEEKNEKTAEIPVKNGVKEKAATAQEELFTYVDMEGSDLSKIERKVQMKKALKAPVKQGQEAGESSLLSGRERNRKPQDINNRGGRKDEIHRRCGKSCG